MFLHDIALAVREGMLCIVKLIAKIPVTELTAEVSVRVSQPFVFSGIYRLTAERPYIFETSL